MKRQSAGYQPVKALAGLEIFGRQSLQASIIDSKEYRLFPTNFYDGFNSVLSFNLPQSTTEFLIPKIFVEISVSILNGDRSDLEPDAKVAPVDSFSSAIFRDVSLRINSQELNQRSGMYAYYSFIKDVFLTSAQSLESHDRLKMTYLSKASQLNTIDNTNPQFEMRRLIAAGSKSFVMYFEIQADIFSQERLIPPATDVALTLYQNDSAFALLSGVEASKRNQIFRIDDVQLHYRRVTINDVLFVSLMKEWRISPAIYPVNRNFMGSINSETSASNIVSNLLPINSILPSSVFVMIVPSLSLMGNLSRNPYQVKNDNVEEIYLSTESEQYPKIPFNPDISLSNKYIRCYSSYLQSSGFDQSSVRSVIDSSMWANGLGLIGFDLSRSTSEGSKSLPKIGHLRIHIKYHRPSTESCQVVYLLVFNNTIYLTSSGQCYTDFYASA